MNEHSSRSHAIFSISVDTRSTDASGAVLSRSGRLNLVDLSGSENVKRSGSTGDRFREVRARVGRALRAPSARVRARLFPLPHARAH